MSSFSGVDVASAPTLAQSLRSWDLQLDDTLALIRQAETLSELTTGVHGALDAIGADGRAMATAVDSAASQIASFRIDLSTFTPRLFTPAAGHTGSQSDAAKHAMAAWMQDGAKQPGDLGPQQKSFVSAARIEGARDEIEQAFIAGSDTAPAIGRYHDLLGEVTGDASAQAAAAAVSFLSQGVPLHELHGTFREGSDAFFGRLAAAMAEGTAPRDAGLQPVFFPAGYVAWHDYDQRETRYTAVAALLERGGPGDPLHIQRPSDIGHLRAWAEESPQDWAETKWLQQLLDGEELSKEMLERIKTRLRPVVLRQLEDLGPRPVVIVETLHGPVPVDDRGRVAAFDAIGAAAATVSPAPASYVGDAYAQFHWGFGPDEVELAFDYLSVEEQAAAAFFASLGAVGTADLLPDFRFENEPLQAGEVARDISIAFGLASNHLPAEFGADTVRSSRDRHRGFALLTLAPEHLFAHGTFVADFLAEAAVEAVTGPDPIFDKLFEIDPRWLVLAAVARQELGIQFVQTLVDGRSLGALVRPTTPIHDPGFATEFGQSDIPVVSQLLVQAAGDASASAALISIAGAHPGLLDLDIANGLSYVIANSLPRYRLADIDDLPDPAMLNAADNVFAVGAGIDIELAAQALLVKELESGFVSGVEEWWLNLSWAPMIGHLEATKYLAHSRVAQAYDESVRNTNRWLSRLSTAGGVVFGIGGLLTSGLASAGYGLAGLASTGLGFFNAGEATAVQHVEEQTLKSTVAIAEQAEGLALLLALELGIVDMPHGTSVEILTTSSATPRIQVTGPTGASKSFVVGAEDWASELTAKLTDLGAMVVHGGGRVSILAAVTTVGWAGINNLRSGAFSVTWEADTKDWDESDDG